MQLTIWISNLTQIALMTFPIISVILLNGVMKLNFLKNYLIISNKIKFSNELNKELILDNLYST